MEKKEKVVRRGTATIISRGRRGKKNKTPKNAHKSGNEGRIQEKRSRGNGGRRRIIECCEGLKGERLKKACWTCR